MGSRARRQTKAAHPDLIAILGPTACGKTRLAVRLAARMGGEILSADSRQLYRGMDIGTGKDLEEYQLSGAGIVPYHLIDICDAGERYDLFRYQQAFYAAYEETVARGSIPILCGGSGLYAESVIRGYSLVPVAPDPRLRAMLKQKETDELIAILEEYGPLHNSTDTASRSRLIRAIEIAKAQREQQPSQTVTVGVAGVFAIDMPREARRERVAQRLKERLRAGLLEEVQLLRAQGVPDETLLYYGLEYKFATLYLQGVYGYEQFVSGLTVAIQQFAKRQMTYLRGMARRGIPIIWLDGMRSVDAQLELIANHLGRERAAD